jgi:hypothetical protein
MIATDTKIVQETLDKLLDKKSYIAIDQKDIQFLFGENPKLRMIQVAANSVNELVPLIEQDLASIGGLPDKCLTVYVSMDMKMSDLELLEDITKDASKCKRAVIFEKNPLGAFMVYCFFE